MTNWEGHSVKTKEERFAEIRELLKEATPIDEPHEQRLIIVQFNGPVLVGTEFVSLMYRFCREGKDP